MSTHNICFHQEIRKISCGYPLLSVAMDLINDLVLSSVAHDIYFSEKIRLLGRCFTRNFKSYFLRKKEIKFSSVCCSLDLTL